MASAVEAHELVLAHGDHVAVRSASFQLPAGAVTAVIGPNGSGKTTLLRAISGLQPVHAGRLRVLGADVGARQTEIAHVLQSTQVNRAIPLTVEEVVRMGRYPRVQSGRRLRRDDRAAVADALRRMDIEPLARQQLQELSGGQQQRVFVAQGLAQQAELLLLDEPVTGLDLTSQERIDHAIRDELAAGRTVVLTTHDVATASRADHVLLLATHVVASGPPGQVLTEEHLGHAYGGAPFRTAGGAVVLADPHVHGTPISGHDHH